MNLPNIFFIAAGAFSVIFAAMDANWFMNNRKAKFNCGSNCFLVGHQFANLG